MRRGTIGFRYFDKGDYVNTFEGMGIVDEDETIVNNLYDLMYNQIRVKIKNNEDRITSVDRHTVLLITKEQYEKA